MARARTIWVGGSRWAAVVATAVVLVAGGAGSARADAQTSTLTASADTFVHLLLSNTNEGSADFLRVSALGDSRTLVRFDPAQLQDAVGGGTLVSAHLNLQIVRNGNDWGPSGRSISVYRLTSDWAEGNGALELPFRFPSGLGATWSCAIDSNIGNLRKDCSGATEWEMLRPDRPHPWAEPASASATITNGQTGTVSFDVTADVAAFLSGTANDGWLVKRDKELALGLVDFGSRESATPPTLVLDVQQGPTENLVQPYPDPTLTADQEAAATAAVQNDPSFNTLIAGNSYSIAGVDPWGKDAHAGLVGAIVNVTLDQPAAISGSWPELTWNGDNATPLYTTQSYDLSLGNVTSIAAYVNLDTNTVVGLDPNADALLTNPAAATRVQLDRTRTRRARKASAVPALQEDPTDFGTGRATNVLSLVCPDKSNCFYNFDFSTKAKDQKCACWNLVDWPVDTIWTGISNIDLVKAYIFSQFGWRSSGGAMAASMNVAPNFLGGKSGWTWDTDKGVKGSKCTFFSIKTPHTRLYAPSDTDQLYSPTYGFYILGTTHYDWGECIGFFAKAAGQHYGGAGYSETVETLIAKEVGNHPDVNGGAIVAFAHPNTIPLGNEEFFTRGDHVAQSNGLATRIDLEPTL